MRYTQLALAIAALGFISSAHATNGMNMEGYGPIASAMGGASMAHDNGTAAVMNNPATLGLMAQGNRLDLALGMMGPNVKMKMGPGPTAKSGGTSYFMPAVGWARKDGAMTYGVAVFAQGGMGTEWDSSTFKSNYSPDGKSMRSELGVGRLIAPLSYDVTPDLTIGGSLDFVWAMMDLKMAMPAAQMGMMGSGPMMGMLPSDATYGRIEFSNGNDFTGKAKGSGFAGKLGFTYKASPTVTLGGTYHSKTSLSDMKTGSSGASFTVDGTGGMTMPGKITIKDFQWPEIYGLGMAVQATPDLLVVADIKRIGWSNVMKNFKMRFDAPMPGAYANLTMPQKWDDQTVFSLGAAYKTTPALTLRAGASFSDNPIPSRYMNFLFPAIEKNHFTAGLGYAFSKDSDLNFSLQYAPKVTQTNAAGLAPVKVNHSQTSWQLMYSARF